MRPVHVFAFKMQIDPSRAGSARPTGSQRGVGARAVVDQSLDRPGLTAVKTGPNRRPLAFGIRRVDVAEDENVLTRNRQPRQPAHATVGAMLMPVG